MGKRPNYLYFLNLISLLVLGFVSSVMAAEKVGGELKQGRYIGSITLEPTKDKIAVVSDFFLESPEDLKLFPALRASFKMTFGGYNTHEYVTEYFDSVRYDFDNGVLTLDDPKNDIVFTAEVHQVSGNPQIIGDVFIRSSALFGKLTLSYETDEPGGDGDGRGRENADKTFIPLLDGQYEGTCAGERAVLQLQTIRGLKAPTQSGQSENGESSLSRYYGISARVGLQNSIMCGNLPPKLWCALFSYGGGSYNAYQGKLTLKGPYANDECTVDKDGIKCKIRRTSWNKDCEFKKTTASIKEAKFYSRSFNLNPTADQLKALPAAEPPKNAALSSAVRGAFVGYVHNETNDTYQYLQLSVMPFSFTDNPHNPNQMMISSTASFYLGRDFKGPYITQRFEPRSFYIRPGFTLTGPYTDSFINISEWKTGFIRGVLYSHAFGRVGTVQLVKGTVPPPPANIEMVRNFSGEFGGPLDSKGVSANMRWFRFLFPSQPGDLTDNLIHFSGSYNPVVGLTAVRNIEQATFDPFTGVLGWVMEQGGAATFSTGYIDKSDNVRMYWPSAPDIYGVHMTDYEPETFKRKAK